MQKFAVGVDVFLDVADLAVDLLPSLNCGGPSSRSLHVVITGIELNLAEGLDQVVKRILGGIVAFRESFAASAVEVDGR